MTKTIPQLDPLVGLLDLASLMEISIPGGGSRKLPLTGFAPSLVISGTELTIKNLLSTSTNFASEFSGITVLSFPQLTELIGSFLPSAISLVSIDLPVLQTILGSFIPADASVALNSINLPELVFVGGSFNLVHMAGLTSIDLSNLVSVGTLSYTGTVHGSLTASGGTGLTSIDLSSLAVIGGDFDPQLVSLAHLALPAITSIGRDFDLYSEEILTISLNSGLKKIGGLVSLEGVGKLDQASVDGMLVRIAALDGTNGTTSFDNKTVDLSGGTNASPSATGLAAKVILEGRGNTVTVN